MSTTDPDVPLPRSVRFLFALSLALVAAMVYAPSLSGGLVYDDLLLVERSPATQSIGGALSHAFEPFFAFAQADSVTQRGLWRPLTSLFLAVGRTIGGVTTPSGSISSRSCSTSRPRWWASASRRCCCARAPG